MAVIGNLIWFFLLGGFFLGAGWLVAGVLLCLTVVGIPFGQACFRISSFAFFPFGKELVDARSVGEGRIAGTSIANLLWFLLAGVWLALGHLAASLACLASCLLVVPIFLGAPAWAVAHFNLAKVSLAPLGMRIVPKR